MPAPHAPAAGLTVTNIVTHEFDKPFTGASDILEMAMLPRGHRVVGVSIGSDIAGINTADVVLLSGKFGTLENREPETTIAAGLSIDATHSEASMGDCLAVPKPEDNVSIGIALSADVAQGAGTLTLVVVSVA